MTKMSILAITKDKLQEIGVAMGQTIKVHTIGLQPGTNYNLTYAGNERVVHRFIDGSYQGAYAMWLDYRVQVLNETGAEKVVSGMDDLVRKLVSLAMFEQGDFRNIKYHENAYPQRETAQDSKNMMVYRIKIEATYDCQGACL